MLLTALLLLLAQGAGETSDAHDGRPCEEARTQMEMNSCAAREFESVDQALNEQWRQTLALMRNLDGDAPGDDGQPGYVETLRAAQRAWLTYRDEHCRAESFIARGGSMQTMLEHYCKAYVTQRRTIELGELTQSLQN